MTATTSAGAVHVVLPDTQVKPGVPTAHLSWIGNYIVDRWAGQENVKVVHLGDHWDMPSLSSYDKGKRSMEGRRVLADIAAGNEGFAVLNEPFESYNAKQRAAKHATWNPEKHLLRGNHEHRIQRAIEDDAQVEGLLSYDLLLSPGWEVHDFLEVIDLDGVWYSHFFQAAGTGRPLGGTAMNRLVKLGNSFTQGHQQTYDPAVRFLRDGRQQRGLVVGACYLHTEDYLGYQGNAHWRGIVVKHQVKDGGYDLMEVSLDYLCRRYEDKPLAVWMKEQGLHEELALMGGAV